MRDLLILRNKLYNFVGKYEAYVKPVCKLLLAMIVFSVINGSLGYMEKIDSVAIVMIAALMCSFLPIGFIVFLSAVFIVLHLYELSLEVAIVGLVLFLILFLLYFRLAPKDNLVVLLTSLLSGMGIPYVIPVSMGLVGSPASGVSIGCGVIVSHFLKTVKAMAPTLQTMESEDMPARLRYVIDSLIEDKTMIVLIVAFAITVIVVYIISQLPIKFSWSIAIGTGAFVQFLTVLIAQAFVDNSDISVGGLLIGTLLAIVVGMVVQFFKFNVDYKRTEKVHFEDDEYHYYVKAIPKQGVVAASRKTVKRRPVSQTNRRPQQQQYQQMPQQQMSQQQMMQQRNNWPMEEEETEQ